MSPAESLAVRLQFPRRVVLLLFSFGLAWPILLALPGALFGDFPGGGGSRIAEAVAQRLPVSLALLSFALLLALIQALIAALIAVGLHSLEARLGPAGSALKAFGRLWVFGQAAAPVFVLALFLVLIFAVQLGIVPATWGAPGGRSGALERLPALVLPVLCLALLPTVLTGQVMAREVTLPRDEAGPRIWLSGLLKGAAALSGQTGGLISSLVLVESVFAIPGLGRMFIDGIMFLEAGLLVGALIAYAGIILAGRLAAELFRWLARLLQAPPPAALPEASTPWRKTARRTWVTLALVMLVAPIGLGLAGLSVDPERASQVSVGDRNSPPSSEHLLGTDSLGRDVQAQVLRGGLTSVGLAAVAAVLITLVGGLGGALTGWLAVRRTLWAESLADLLLTPADVLLFFPAVPGAVALALIMRSESWVGPVLAAAVVLAPRAARYFQTLWLAASIERPGGGRLLAGLASLLLGAWFAALALLASLDFLGLGVRPPTPTLGGMLGAAMSAFRLEGMGLIAPGVALWLCALAFFTASDALAGYFPTKEALARINE